MGSIGMWGRARSGFETTQWSRVVRSSQGAREALGELFAAYWQPIYGFIRARGFSPEEAKDLTQGLFTKLLAPGALARVDPELGRFRDWLRAAARHFLCNQRDRGCAEKRGGARAPVTIDVHRAEENLLTRAQQTMTPERLYDRRWAMAVTNRALARLRAEYVEEGNGDLFSRLEGLLSGEEGGATDAELCQSLGKTVGALRVQRHRMKKEVRARYRRHLREEIGRTVGEPQDIDQEIRGLIDALDG